MPKARNLVKIGVPLVGLVASALILLLIIGVLRAWWTSPLPVFGWGRPPEQPVAFPHTVHVQPPEQGLSIPCQFCHRNAAAGEAATVPSVELCMFCHEDIGEGQASGEKMFAGKGIPAVERLRELWRNQEPINWARVYHLPDHVHFTHEPHIRFFTEQKEMETQQVCTLCHGDVASMETVRQEKDLKMGDCVDCHRRASAPTDCSTCHY